MVSVPVPEVPAATLHLYRERKDAPLHAIAAELWVGGEKKAIAEAVHCFGGRVAGPAVFSRDPEGVFWAVGEMRNCCGLRRQWNIIPNCARSDLVRFIRGGLMSVVQLELDLWSSWRSRRKIRSRRI